MVADQGRRDRGQLILVGCLALALVIIGIGAVINTTLYTESASPALSNVQIDDASTFNLETRRGTRALVHRINHREAIRDGAALHDQVEGSVNNYSELLAVSYARTEPAVVDVVYHPADSKLGTRVIQRADGTFDAALQNELNADQQVGWFAMNVNVSGTGAGAPFGLTMADPDGDTVHWEIQRNVTGETSNLTIETTYLDDSAGTTTERTAHCNPVRNRVLVDGFTGQVVADACVGDDTVFGVGRLDPPHRITAIDQADEFHGTWELVTNETWNPDPSLHEVDRCYGISPSPPRTEACFTPVVWTANITASYRGQDASFVRDRNMSVYGPDK